LGWAAITHPFHPLRGQRFEVLKSRRVAGIDTLILRHPERGSYTVARDWTDWDLPEAFSGTERRRKLAVEPLLQLARLLAELDERERGGLEK
jgi:hypothetical protein